MASTVDSASIPDQQLKLRDPANRVAPNARRYWLARAAVRAAHVAATAAGAEIIQPPRDWEEAQLDYYGAQFSDPAGNLIEVLYRQPG